MGRLAELQRKNLEHLMGAEAMGIIQVDLKFTDPKVCRSYLCGACPHDLFTNTKMDLGACPKTHSQKLKGEYEAALSRNQSDDPEESAVTVSRQELQAMRREYENNILGFVEECDRRIRAAQKRLEKTPEENNRTTALMREIGEIQTAYEGAMAEVETLGESGQVDQSMVELAKAEALKAEKLEKERELQQLTETSGASGHQKLRVCDICGAYLSILDSDRRLADHFGGKMHLGYLQLRQTIEEWRTRPHGLNVPSIHHNANPGLTAGLQAAHFGQQRAQAAAAAQNASEAPNGWNSRSGDKGRDQNGRRSPSVAVNGGDRDKDRERDRDRDRDRDRHSRDDRDWRSRDDHRSSRGDKDYDERRSSRRDGDDYEKRKYDDGRSSKDDREKRRRYD
ncbi:hypothetical protein O181_005253 [Austropuccinia psidii MF-1]|uniref:LUC7-domain-containing protein n=1 Tax=Austropuccinia psidii MF-1 TaxID=1389203 RepID=A0A9Q3BI63_9BASI|nr:hypothetical protein [Austropuccinia psidii MF-1]